MEAWHHPPFYRTIPGGSGHVRLSLRELDAARPSTGPGGGGHNRTPRGSLAPPTHLPVQAAASTTISLRESLAPPTYLPIQGTTQHQGFGLEETLFVFYNEVSWKAGKRLQVATNN